MRSHVHLKRLPRTGGLRSAQHPDPPYLQTLSYWQLCAGVFLLVCRTYTNSLKFYIVGTVGMLFPPHVSNLRQLDVSPFKN